MAITHSFWVILPLVAGYLADLRLADPEHWPHPIRAFGWLVSQTEKRLNQGGGRLFKGLLATITLIFLVYFACVGLREILTGLHPMLALGFDALLVFWGIANQGLIREVRQVFVALQQGLENGRKQLSRIVGRDTSALTPHQIQTAALESLSENLSDGSIAPLFFYGLLGSPGIMAYKMINTLDSMWGYRNERFEQFGKGAARIDDIANFIPARLTALLMAFTSLSWRSLRFSWRYGRAHKSPNSGYPEAALAGVLDCRFGGPNIYHGQIVDKPYIGEQERVFQPNDLRCALRLNHKVTLTMLVITCVMQLLQF